MAPSLLQTCLSLLLASASGFASGGDDPCACTDNDAATKAALVKAGYSADFGSYCNDWDADTARCQPGGVNYYTEGPKEFQGASGFCASNWCYVDPKCESAVPSVYFRDNYEGLKDLAYSYLACGNADPFSLPATVDTNENGLICRNEHLISRAIQIAALFRPGEKGVTKDVAIKRTCGVNDPKLGEWCRLLRKFFSGYTNERGITIVLDADGDGVLTVAEFLPKNIKLYGPKGVYTSLDDFLQREGCANYDLYGLGFAALYSEDARGILEKYFG